MERHSIRKGGDYLPFWGKADRDDATSGWHPAACHMLDVAAVALAWLERTKPQIPGLSDVESYYSTIAALVALHDIGKFSRSFQGKVEARWPSVLGPYCQPPSDPRHDSAGFAMLRGQLAPKLEQLLSNIPKSERLVLLRAICGHHGSPPEEAPRKMDQTVCAACVGAASAFIDDLFTLFRPIPLPAMNEPDVVALSWWLAGLTVLSDWIGSNEDWFHFAPGCQSLEDYWPVAQASAARAVAQAGILPIAARSGFGIASLLPEATSPAPMQTLAATLDLGAPRSPVLVIIEDQTGSGKTEAALLLAQRIMAEKQARGLFIALPTMATANALHERLSALYFKLFAEGGETPSLVLAHGKRLLNDRFAAAMRAHTDEQLISANDNADETATAQCVGWIAADRRRAFLADCGVGTIDQALHAVLPTRHAPLRLLGLRDRVLIVDEAHAYDSYMGLELFRLIEFQARLGGSTIILSATLPLAKRQEFLSVFRGAVGGGKISASQTAYPLVTTATAEMMAEIPCPPRTELAREIHVKRLPDAEAALDAIADAATRGAAVAWIRNTVDDAIAAQALLATRGIAATLFHARFAMGDRLNIESQVQGWFGKGEARDRAHVVVGTQVMEQSLDIDVDLMVTDLAPIDLMLQRAGRLWRHQRQRRPVPAPRLLVIAPDPVTAPPLDWLREMRGTEAVYRDPALLWRSARAIFTHAILRVPEDVRNLVEAAYAEDAEIPDGLRQKSDQAHSKEMSAAAIAGMNLLRWNDGYCRANGPWESDVRTPTRLSDPSLMVRLALWDGEAVRPWFKGETPGKSWALSEISLPLRRVERVPDAAGMQANALVALRRLWPRMEQETPVLVLRPDGDTWVGTALGPGSREIRLRYSRVQGMTFEPL